MILPSRGGMRNYVPPERLINCAIWVRPMAHESMDRRPLKSSCIPATAFVSAVDARFEGDVPMSATQPLPAAAKVDVKVATTSIRPADFANASPFRTRSTQRDPGRTALFVAAAIALLALLAGIVAVLTMHAPTP